MTPITLEAVKAEQQRLDGLIAALEAQSRMQTYAMPAVEIRLQPGERYAGIILGEGCECNYHLILLPGLADNVTWQQAQDWATRNDGYLPTRREQALLYANLKDQFAEAWYWSGAQHESNEASAWCQDFYYGSQYGSHHGIELRARAVRRLTV